MLKKEKPTTWEVMKCSQVWVEVVDNTSNKLIYLTYLKCSEEEVLVEAPDNLEEEWEEWVECPKDLVSKWVEMMMDLEAWEVWVVEWEVWATYFPCFLKWEEVEDFSNKEDNKRKNENCFYYMCSEWLDL